MKILVVEDDRSLANMVKLGLASDAHTIELADDGADGSFLARSFEYDTVILDYSLPRKDGISICNEVRKAGKNMPILFMSTDSETSTKVRALKSGADDYITKPFSMDELRARIDAISRRPKQIMEKKYEVADLVLDANSQLVKRSGKILHLTHKEYALLEYMIKNVGIVLSRAMIMECVWSSDADPMSNTIEAHIRNLRQKINLVNSRKKVPNLIANIPGRGYVMDTPLNLKKYWGKF